MDKKHYYSSEDGETSGRKRRQEEFHLQCQIVRWFRMNPATREYVIFAIPNGGSRHLLEAANLKKSGALAGVPDLLLCSKSRNNPGLDLYLGLFIELKSKKGKVSDAQEDIIDRLECSGYRVAVCRSFEDAKNEIEEYLGIK